MTEAPSALSDGLGITIDDGTGPVRVIAGPDALGALSPARGDVLVARGPLGQRDSTGTGSSGYRLHATMAGELEAVATPTQPPTPTVAPSPTPSVAPSASPSASPTAAPSPTPTPAPSATPAPTGARRAWQRHGPSPWARRRSCEGSSSPTRVGSGRRRLSRSLTRRVGCPSASRTACRPCPAGRSSRCVVRLQTPTDRPSCGRRQPGSPSSALAGSRRRCA